MMKLEGLCLIYLETSLHLVRQGSDCPSQMMLWCWRWELEGRQSFPLVTETAVTVSSL